MSCLKPTFGNFTLRLSEAAYLPAHLGHPLPLVLLTTLASHSCPFSQIHQTFLPVLGVTSSGVNSPFLVGCHCAATFGNFILRLYSGESRRDISNINHYSSLIFIILPIWVPRGMSLRVYGIITSYDVNCLQR